jgi:ureidoglycolate lyase
MGGSAGGSSRARIRAQPLTAEAFAPFGQVLMAAGHEAQRHEFAARLENRRLEAKPNLTFIRAESIPGQYAVSLVERHPQSSQTFVPLNGTRYVVAVCPSVGEGVPDLDRLAVFVAEGSQAINYNAGAWHAPHRILSGPGEFVMLRWDDGTEDDTESRPLGTAIEVELPG